MAVVAVVILVMSNMKTSTLVEDMTMEEGVMEAGDDQALVGEPIKIPLIGVVPAQGGVAPVRTTGVKPATSKEVAQCNALVSKYTSKFRRCGYTVISTNAFKELQSDLNLCEGHVKILEINQGYVSGQLETCEEYLAEEKTLAESYKNQLNSLKLEVSSYVGLGVHVGDADDCDEWSEVEDIDMAYKSGPYVVGVGTDSNGICKHGGGGEYTVMLATPSQGCALTITEDDVGLLYDDDDCGLVKVKSGTIITQEGIDLTNKYHDLISFGDSQTDWKKGITSCLTKTKWKSSNEMICSGQKWYVCNSYSQYTSISGKICNGGEWI